MLDFILKSLGLSRVKKEYKLKSAVARWAIFQFITCPYCRHEFDIIAINLKRKTNQGTVTVSQKQVSRFDKDKFEYADVTSEIPTPPYFGAMLENTENLEEKIDCVHCEKTIVVHESLWQYGK